MLLVQSTRGRETAPIGTPAGRDAVRGAPGHPLSADTCGLTVAHHPVREDGCSGALRRVSGGAQVRPVGERDHLRHLFGRYLRQAEARDRRPDTASQMIADIDAFEESATIAE